MNDQVLRTQLVDLLRGHGAHASPADALAGVKPSRRGARPPGFPHALWDLLEHMRIAQQDILRYTLDPDWESPSFPEGYWPEQSAEAVSDESWSDSVSGFVSELDEMVALVEDAATDLTARIPHTKDHTYLREVLILADHNAYHLGQIVDLRRALGDWPGAA